MPFYRYYCEVNQMEVDVRHAMSERLQTWGQVCEYAKMDPGSTPLESPVVRLISKPLVSAWKLKGLDADAPSDRLSF